MMTDYERFLLIEALQAWRWNLDNRGATDQLVYPDPKCYTQLANRHARIAGFANFFEVECFRAKMRGRSRSEAYYFTPVRALQGV